MTIKVINQQERKYLRRKRERIIITTTLAIMLIITYLESQILPLANELSLDSSILIFLLININALLLFLLIFLVLRNLFKLTLEKRTGIWGSRLRTRLVLAFVILSLAPTILLFFAAFQFVGTSINYLISKQTERSLIEALEVGDSYHRCLAENIAHYALLIGNDLELRWLSTAAGPSARGLISLLESRRVQYNLTGLWIFGPDLKELVYTTQNGIDIAKSEVLPLELVKRTLSQNQTKTILQDTLRDGFVAAIQPIKLTHESRDYSSGLLIAVFMLPNGALIKMKNIQHDLELENSRQLKALQNPIRTNQYITLSLVTLLIIFAATWFGFHLAKTITAPLMEIAQGAQRIASGDYDVFIDSKGSDEIGILINIFNRMSADLKISKASLDEAQFKMARTNMELEQRRRYMEIVLNNVAAGVVAIDAQGKVTTFNPSAERLLKVSASKILGLNWRLIFQNENLKLVNDFLSGLTSNSRTILDRQLHLNISGEPLTLMVHLGLLRDENNQSLGLVVVFEDLTELEKAQRMAAWREVARRIAHEVKNPLTPIKLSAQRLARRYRHKLSEDRAIFDECTETIVHQVEEIGKLVNEFSTFARLPNVRLAPADLNQIAGEIISFFRSAHPEISFGLDIKETLPIFNLDKEQMSRVLINLLDNAVSAIQINKATQQIIIVRLIYDDILKIARLEVEDNGPGVLPNDRLRLFEPYFSTKKGGTGLGLTIVSTIVADHNGYIRVRDNQPQGTRIIIELPTRRIK